MLQVPSTRLVAVQTTGVDGCGQVWTGVDGCGQVWTGVDGCGQVCSVVRSGAQR